MFVNSAGARHAFLYLAISLVGVYSGTPTQTRSSASELLETDLAQAQFDLQELSDKRDSWLSMCNLKPRASAEWEQCRGVAASGTWEIDQKKGQVASYQQKLSFLSRQGTRVVSESADTGEVAEALDEHLSRARVELDELSGKLDSWRDLCAGPPEFLSRRSMYNSLPSNKLSASVLLQHHQQKREGVDPHCLEVMQGIRVEIAAKSQEVTSYQSAIVGLHPGGSD